MNEDNRVKNHSNIIMMLHPSEHKGKIAELVEKVDEHYMVEYKKIELHEPHLYPNIKQFPSDVQLRNFKGRALRLVKGSVELECLKKTVDEMVDRIIYQDPNVTIDTYSYLSDKDDNLIWLYKQETSPNNFIWIYEHPKFGSMYVKNVLLSLVQVFDLIVKAPIVTELTSFSPFVVVKDKSKYIPVEISNKPLVETYVFIRSLDVFGRVVKSDDNFVSYKRVDFLEFRKNTTVNKKIIVSDDQFLMFELKNNSVFHKGLKLEGVTERNHITEIPRMYETGEFISMDFERLSVEDFMIGREFTEGDLIRAKGLGYHICEFLENGKECYPTVSELNRYNYKVKKVSNKVIQLVSSRMDVDMLRSDTPRLFALVTNGKHIGKYCRIVYFNSDKIEILLNVKESVTKKMIEWTENKTKMRLKQDSTIVDSFELVPTSYMIRLYNRPEITHLSHRLLVYDPETKRSTLSLPTKITKQHFIYIDGSFIDGKRLVSIELVKKRGSKWEVILNGKKQEVSESDIKINPDMMILNPHLFNLDSVKIPQVEDFLHKEMSFDFPLDDTDAVSDLEKDVEDGEDFDGEDFDGEDFDGKDFDGKDFDGKDFDGKDFDGKDFDGEVSFKDIERTGLQETLLSNEEKMLLKFVKCILKRYRIDIESLTGVDQIFIQYKKYIDDLKEEDLLFDDTRYILVFLVYPIVRNIKRVSLKDYITDVFELNFSGKKKATKKCVDVTREIKESIWLQRSSEDCIQYIVDDSGNSFRTQKEYYRIFYDLINTVMCYLNYDKSYIENPFGGEIEYIPLGTLKKRPRDISDYTIESDMVTTTLKKQKVHIEEDETDKVAPIKKDKERYEFASTKNQVERLTQMAQLESEESLNLTRSLNLSVPSETKMAEIERADILFEKFLEKIKNTKDASLIPQIQKLRNIETFIPKTMDDKRAWGYLQTFRSLLKDREEKYQQRIVMLRRQRHAQREKFNEYIDDLRKSKEYSNQVLQRVRDLFNMSPELLAKNSSDEAYYLLNVFLNQQKLSSIDLTAN